MPPKYRLQTVLDLRKRAEDEAKQEFATAMQALVAAQSELKRLQEDLARRRREHKEKLDQYMKELCAKGMGARGIQSMGTYDQRLRDEEEEVERQIEAQKKVVAEAQAEVDRKRAALAEAAKRVKAIEKHKEKFLKLKKMEREAREDQAGEEIGNALFLARQRAGKAEPES